jgi:S-DNA-T family DNA segregation ATPase FtsK/SpoIIIE
VTLVVSVTEVRNALRCPRIFALGRMQRREVVFPVTASSLGAAFHRIVEAFAATIPAPAPPLAALGSDASEPAIARAIAAALLDQAAGEIERTPSYASMPAEVDDLAEALRELARYLAKEAHALGGQPASALTRLLDRSELDVSDAIDIGDGQAVLLTGRLDALYARSSGSIDVVEYKLTPESNDELDRAQVALYRYLLRESREIDAQPVVLRFQPRLSITRLEREAADALVQERLLPLVRDMVDWAVADANVPGPSRDDLCPSCPVRSACAATYTDYLASRDQPPAGAARPLPDAQGDSLPPRAAIAAVEARADDATGRAESEKLRGVIQRIYRGQGVNVTIAEPTIGARVISFEVRAGRGSVRSVDRAADDVVHRLEAEHSVSANYMRDGGLRTFEVARKEARKVLLTALLQRNEDYLRKKPGRFVIGEGVNGEAVRGDLSDPSTCHVLVGGASGSGKTVLLQTLVACLAHYHAPDAIRFTLVDPKRVSFGPFRTSLSAHLAHPLCHDAAQAVEILVGLVHEMEERYQEFELAGVEDLDAYNESVSAAKRFARHIVVVDEFADLLAQKSLRESFLSVVARLCAKARAAGIHLILATQRPDAKTVPGVIKTNLVGRIALKVPDGVASRIVINQLGAERLLGKGDLFADFGTGAVRGQAAVLRA